MVSICTVPSHVWTHALWSHLSQVLNVFMSKFPNICTIPYLSLFPEINFFWKATSTKKILFPGSQIFQLVTFPGKSHFPENQEKFPMKLQFPGIHTFPRFSGKQHISQEVIFSGKTNFPENFRELIFLGKSHFSWKSHFP